MKTWSSSKKLMTQFLVKYPHYLGSVPDYNLAEPTPFLSTWWLQLIKPAWLGLSYILHLRFLFKWWNLQPHLNWIVDWDLSFGLTSSPGVWVCNQSTYIQNGELRSEKEITDDWLLAGVLSCGGDEGRRGINQSESWEWCELVSLMACWLRFYRAAFPPSTLTLVLERSFWVKVKGNTKCWSLTPSHPQMSLWCIMLGCWYDDAVCSLMC